MMWREFEKKNLIHGGSIFFQNDGASSSSATVTEAILIPSTSKECGGGGRMDPLGESPSAFASGQSVSSISCVSTKPSDVICNPWRNLVSQNRRRYKKDRFDLDLTYITDRIIAMGFPALDQEKIYRNSMEATVNFLERYHADHYMVFNLRGHHIYDPSYFHNRVMMFEMNDHHPPRLELMAPFCRAVHEYLAADDRNVVAVHCKAGKGRTGVMICAYLVYINFYLSPRQNMDYYSIVRTVNNKVWFHCLPFFLNKRSPSNEMQNLISNAEEDAESLNAFPFLLLDLRLFLATHLHFRLNSPTKLFSARIMFACFGV
ncbi:unnamed protein product [Toxocara canis]|uniref:phosphatidylinositol-3,4,5-trisphosphate 3-phosphatase n=1 Tax=Toxocara canis TaxID=6265 RepID=A0A183V3J3_TOXCA|nr:unnamed protein product [Toxocara canis]